MGLVGHIRDLHAARSVLFALVAREFRLRYRQTVIGILWAILQPLSMMLIAVLVFGRFARLPSSGIAYPLFYYSGFLLWNFFAVSVSFGMMSLVNNASLVTKVYFPREILPVSSVLVSLLDLIVAGALLLILMVFYGVYPGVQALWAVPILLSLACFTLGLSILVAALTVFFRDFRFAVPLVLWLWFFASPVVYPADVIPDSWRWLLLANPVAGSISSLRRALLLGQAPETAPMLSCAAIGLGVLVASYLLFKRMEGRFADVV
jgi:lipopolysaccharide transport system permease protein